MWRIVVACALLGCNSILGIHEIPRDGSGSGDGGSTCFGSPPFVICLMSLPTGATSLPSTIDTSSMFGGANACPDDYDVPPNHPWCVFSGTTITIDATMVVTAGGARPLVLVATGDLTISGTLDASSHHLQPTLRQGGPGANMACPGGDGHTTATGDTGGGAGAGGSFGSEGGVGGAGGDSTALGGIALPASQTPMTLRGGCAGGLGAAGLSALASDPCQGRPSQPAGMGGGAVYLLAGGTMTIDGVVAANGEGGGQGLFARGGGSGGGSGGMIVLWSANKIAGTGIVMASGGGGGGGADHCATAATGGSDPSLTTIVAAPGGPGGGNAPAGGDGGAFTSAGANGAAGGSKGGSAGGGGVGFILVHGTPVLPAMSSGIIVPY